MEKHFEFKIIFSKIISNECECGYKIERAVGLPKEDEFKYIAPVIIIDKFLSIDKNWKPTYAFLVNHDHDSENISIASKYSIYITDRKYQNRHFYLDSFLSKDDKELLVVYLKNASDFMNAISLYIKEKNEEWNNKEIVVL